VLQQAIAQVLTPIFEPTFSDSSFGFRPGRNAHMAIRQVQAYVKDGYRIAVDLDLAKFFDTVNHDLLMSLLGRTIADRRLLALIGRYLRAGVLVGEHVQPSEVARRKADRCHRCWPTSCCTSSTKNCNAGATASPATPTTWSSWSKANARESG
jgi:hypothetical protein